LYYAAIAVLFARCRYCILYFGFGFMYLVYSSPAPTAYVIQVALQYRSGPQDKGGHFCVQNGESVSWRWRAPPISEAESQKKPEVEYQNSEVGSQKPEVKSRKSEA
jgi:hypothetical protein